MDEKKNEYKDLESYLTDRQKEEFKKEEIERLEYLIGTINCKEVKRSVVNCCLETKRYVPQEVNNYMDLMEKAEYDFTKDSLSMEAIQVINSPLDKLEVLRFFQRMYDSIDKINEAINKKENKGDKSRCARKLCSMLRQRPRDLDTYLIKCLED